MAITYWWLILVSAIPATLASILFFLDQQITTVIINRKDNKFKVNQILRCRYSKSVKDGAYTLTDQPSSFGNYLVAQWSKFHSFEQSSFTIIFPLAVSSPNNACELIVRTTNCRLHSNISQMLYCFVKHGAIITNLTLCNPCGVLLICQNTTVRVFGAWVILYYVLCSKRYGTFSCLL